MDFILKQRIIESPMRWCFSMWSLDRCDCSLYLEPVSQTLAPWLLLHCGPRMPAFCFSPWNLATALIPFVNRKHSPQTSSWRYISTRETFPIELTSFGDHASRRAVISGQRHIQTHVPSLQDIWLPTKWLHWTLAASPGNVLFFCPAHHICHMAMKIHNQAYQRYHLITFHR